MKTKLVAAAILLSGTGAISAHRLDGYLQATMISVGSDRAEVSMRLVPGVAVAAAVLGDIDTNRDGSISNIERQAYAERVLGEVSLSVDGNRLSQRLVSVTFPTPDEIKQGLGEIQIEFRADLPRGGARRKLVFENHYQSRIAAYLVNCLVPRDPKILIVAQKRNEMQSVYQLEYRETSGVSESRSADSPSSGGALSSGLESVRYWFHGWASMYLLGIRHIAEGTDHLLFLITLLLPAPLLAAGSRWAGPSDIRHGLLQVMKIVTAFTVGHSITLALAALGLVHVPSRSIEVLIAVSILVSAAHALCPLFPGREAGIAASFGLIHGLAFAATLAVLGLSRWQRVSGILGFNLGIETMQLVVVAATMPSLALLSRTRAYSVLRVGGALFAGFASACWIAERALDVRSGIDVVVNSLAHHAIWIAVLLFVISLACWLARNVADKRGGVDKRGSANEGSSPPILQRT
jgi:hypothetical protein